jgi:TIR domain
MRVFISWSGDLSKELAEVIRNWLPSALQYVKPYFSPADIEKGSKWATEIFKELSASETCIIVLTRDNLTSNWIMFEAGAISCTIDRARVCPLIFNLEETDLQGPLAQFQATKFIKSDIRKLFLNINSSAGEQKLSDTVADGVFEKWWPDLEVQISATLDGHRATKSKQRDVRSERDLIEELLSLTRKISTDIEATKAPAEVKRASFPGAVRYENSVYKKMAILVKQFFGLGRYTNEDLTALKAATEALLPMIRERIAATETKVGLMKDLTELSELITKFVSEEE